MNKPEGKPAADDSALIPPLGEGRDGGTPAPTPAPAPATEATVTLQTPIVRGKENIERITLRRPKSGALRGIKLLDLLQMDGTAIMALLPRITEPPLLAHEVAQLDPTDLIAMGGEVLDFLLPGEAKAQALEAAGL